MRRSGGEFGRVGRGVLVEVVVADPLLGMVLVLLGKETAIVDDAGSSQGVVADD